MKNVNYYTDAGKIGSLIFLNAMAKRRVKNNGSPSRNPADQDR